jgi:signal transduction histidine kinase
MVSKSSIRYRIYRSFFLLVLFFVVNAVITIFVTGYNKRLSAHITTVIDPSVQALQDFKMILVKSKMLTTNWVFLRANQDDKQSLKNLHTVDYPQLKRKLHTLSNKLDNPRLADSLQHVFTRFEQVIAIEKAIMASLQTFGDYNDPVKKLEAERVLEEQVIPRTEQLTVALNKIDGEENGIKIAAYDHREHYSLFIGVLILVLAIIIIGLGILLSVYLINIITEPIKKIKNMVDDLGKGKIGKIDYPVKDELGEMVRAVNNLAEKLQESATFAHEVGNRNFGLKFTPLSEDDTLGKALLTMRDNLKTSEAGLLETTEDLLRQNKALEQFTYIISHNLRAPVANISGLSGLLNSEEMEPDESRLLLKALSTSIQRIDEVILDLNYIIQVKQHLHEQMEMVSLSKMISDIRDTFKGIISAENIEFRCDFTEVDDFVTLKSYIGSILYNLVSNSIKYCRPGVPLVIELKSELTANRVKIRHQDNGKGIDLQVNRNKVFGLYNRFDTSVEGKGMGLFMIKTQAEALGGKVTIESVPGNGAVFVLDLPLFKKKLPDPGKSASVKELFLN